MSVRKTTSYDDDESLENVLGARSGDCQIEDFENNERLKFLAAQREMMNRQNFSFLHSECESDVNCNPFGDEVMPKELCDCCGLKEGEILFNSPQMAAIGKALAGKQSAGQSAVLGHANLYRTGVIAPGVDPNQLWVNVCYLVLIALSTLDKQTRETVEGKMKLIQEANAR